MTSCILHHRNWIIVISHYCLNVNLALCGVWDNRYIFCEKKNKNEQKQPVDFGTYGFALHQCKAKRCERILLGFRIANSLLNMMNGSMQLWSIFIGRNLYKLYFVLYFYLCFETEWLMAVSCNSSRILT